MIPSVLQELKENRFKLIRYQADEYGLYLTYKTESNWIIELSNMHFPLLSTVYINSQKVGWIYGWRIRRAINKGMKR